MQIQVLAHKDPWLIVIMMGSSLEQSQAGFVVWASAYAVRPNPFHENSMAKRCGIALQRRCLCVHLWVVSRVIQRMARAQW